MISAGEGGAAVTDDRMIYERMLMFHDVGTPFRTGEVNEPKLSVKPFPGVNYRINEISSAILRAQLKKEDRIIAKVRSNKAKIKKGISGISGIQFRKLPDPEGEIGVALVFFVDKPEKARIFRDAILAEGIKRLSGMYPGVMYDPKRFDGHIFTAWGHLIPGVDKLAKGDLVPSLDLLGRAVHIDVSPMDTEEGISDIIEAINKIARVIL